MMAAFWPTAEPAKNLPEVAKGMNDTKKLVVSHRKINMRMTGSRTFRNGNVFTTYEPVR